jgi:hypothetical protein
MWLRGSNMIITRGRPLAKTSNDDTKNRRRKEAREQMARRILSARKREAVGLYASILGMAHLT